VTTFSSVFDPIKVKGLRKSRSFKRLVKVIETDDGLDDVHEPGEPLRLRKSITLPAGSVISIEDQEVLDEIARTGQFTDLDRENETTFAVVQVGEDTHEFCYAELEFVITNPPSPEVFQIARGRPNELAAVLAASLIYWRDPFE
jgi:hypothetical protein